MNKFKKKRKEKEIYDQYSRTIHISKYRRTKEELKELAKETNLSKSETCYFMLNIKLLKNDNIDAINSNTEISNEI